MRQNVNASIANATVAAALAAAAQPPEPYSVYAVDEDGNELYDDPPVRRVPMRRRLTVPRGLLGAYDIVTRMDEPEDTVTDAEDDEDEVIIGKMRGPMRDGKTSASSGADAENVDAEVFDLRSAVATREAVARHARATCPEGLTAEPLIRDLYPGDAERDAAVLLERAMRDGKTQTSRLRDREKKLGLGEFEKKRKLRGGRGGRGRGRRGDVQTGRGRNGHSGRLTEEHRQMLEMAKSSVPRYASGKDDRDDASLEDAETAEEDGSSDFEAADEDEDDEEEETL
jgi:hypothetical protein